MTRLKFVDGTTTDVISAEEQNGNLVLVQSGTAETIKSLYKDKKSNLATIQVLNESNTLQSELYGYVCYSSLSDSDDNWKIVLTKEKDTTDSRITIAESNALSALTKSAESLTQSANANTKSESVKSLANGNSATLDEILTVILPSLTSTSAV